VPDINDLDHFDEGLPVTPLPASEVRRRGDRLRRRNTVLATVGGVTAAAVFIGTPVALVANHDTADDVRPAPPGPTSSETSTPGSRWVTTVPDGFPLGAGFPETNADGTPTKVNHSGTEWAASGPFPDVSCAPPGSFEPVAAAGYSYTGEGEETLTRTLVLLADGPAAQAAMAGIRSDAEACQNIQLEHGRLVTRVENLDLGTEESLVLSQQVEEKDGTISGLFVTEIARTGNALFTNSSYGSAGGDQVVAFETDRLRERAGQVLSSMCLFSSEPCQISTGAATEPAPDPPSSLPASDALADFPLAMGYPATNDDGSPVEVTGKPGLGVVELCGAVAWDPGAGTTDVIGVETSVPEDFRGRTLAIYESEDAADAAVEKAAVAVAACPREESDAESGGIRVNRIWDNGGLGDKSVVWTTTYRGPEDERYIGRTVYHLVRVGNAVYGSYESNEGGSSNDALAEAVQSATRAARPIVEAMRGL
jgi:hypothetical protein